MCRIDYADGPIDFYSEHYYKAKKQHKCGECGRDIEIGEKYRYMSGKWEGEFASYKACIHCSEGMDWLTTECGGFMFSEVVEEIEEHARDSYKKLNVHDPLLRFCVGARRHWKKFTSNELMNIPNVE